MALGLIPNSTSIHRGRHKCSSLGAIDREGEGCDGIFLLDVDLADELVFVSEATTPPPTSPEPLTRLLGAVVRNKKGALADDNAGSFLTSEIFTLVFRSLDWRERLSGVSRVSTKPKYSKKPECIEVYSHLHHLSARSDVT